MADFSKLSSDKNFMGSLVDDDSIRETIQNPVLEDAVKNTARGSTLDFSSITNDPEFMSSLDATADPRLNVAVSQGTRENPDKHSRMVKLSKETGIPVDAVIADVPAAEQAAKMAQLNMDLIQQKNPNTARFLSDYNNAAQSHDDIDTLVGVEDWLAKKDEPGFFEKTFDNFGETTKLDYQKGGLGLLLAGTDATPDTVGQLISPSSLPIGMQDMAFAMSQDLAENLGVESDDQLVEAKREAVEKLVGDIGVLDEQIGELTPDDMSILQEGIRGGARMLVDNIPTLAALPAGPGAAMVFGLGSAGTRTFADSYGKARVDGKDPQEAARFAGIDASIEILTEMLPTKALEGMFRPVMKGDITKEAIKFFLAEIPGEQVATFLQSMNAVVHDLDKELTSATPAEAVQIQLRRQAVTFLSALVGGGTQTAIATTAGKVAEKLTTKATDVENDSNTDQKRIDSLIELSQDSKLRNRNADALRDFVHQFASEDDVVHINGKALSDYLEQSGVDPTQDDALKPIADQINEAAALEQDVVMKTADFVAYMAASDHMTALRPHMKLSSETMTPAEAEVETERQQQFLQTLLQEANSQTELNVEAKQVFDAVKAQLQATGRLTAKESKFSAKIIPAYATVIANENGISVLEAYEQMGFDVKGPLAEQQAEQQRRADELLVDQQSEQVMTLAQESGYQGNNTTEALEWVDAQRVQESVDTDQQADTDVFTQDTVLADTVTVEEGSIDEFHALRERLNDQANEQGRTDRTGGRPGQPRSSQVSTTTVGGRAPQDGWVEATRIRSKSGGPLTVYRGSAGGITAENFNPAQFGAATGRPSSGLGVFFSIRESEASGYGDTLERFKLDMRRPKVIKTDQMPEFDTVEEFTRYRDDLIKQGYDGVVISGKHLGGSTYVAAFNPDQVIIESDQNIDDDIFMQSGGDLAVDKFRREASTQAADLLAQAAISDTLDNITAFDSAMPRAQEGDYNTNRDLKVDLQKDILEEAAKQGIDLNQDSPEVDDYLTRVGVRDALFALQTNENAVGWYDLTVGKSLELVSIIHPEISTDENAKFAFSWALAVTSNGIKVDKNFELAEAAYQYYKSNGKMPTNIQAGTAQKAINESMGLFNTLVEQLGSERLRKFMLSEFTVSQIQKMGLKLTGENAGTIVRGAAVLGPKIGNGFFSNLNGFFDQLTMDRWLMRTWGRWTGTLIEDRPDMVKLKQAELKDAVREIKKDKVLTKEFEKALGGKLQLARPDELAKQVNKASVSAANRKVFDKTAAGRQIRLAGNALFKYLDGQKEAPQNGNERNRIRKIFTNVLNELQAQGYENLTMSDLQALVWYPERRLYDMAKSAGDVAAGYTDDEAPDYANAARDLVREKGATEDQITDALSKAEKDHEDRVSTESARRADDSGTEGGREDARQFTGKERRSFLKEEIYTRQRLARAGNAKARSYSKPSTGTLGGVRGLIYKPDRTFTNLLKLAELPAVTLVEMESTAENAAKFESAIQASKDSTKFGAAVYVYPADEYQGMRLFQTEDGLSGFAIKSDGDIVSAYSSGGGGIHSMLALAVEQGGTKLDAFDTVLPELYSISGFREVARDQWNEDYKPDDWDKNTFSQFNQGEPDIVYMEYDAAFNPFYQSTVFEQSPVEQTDTESFKEWSGGGDVIESEDINDHDFKADTPTVVKVFHGTTHNFSVFDALRGNLEGQFGAVNYFTSSEQDASNNYAGEGPDLTQRIEQRTEQLANEVPADPEAFGTTFEELKARGIEVLYEIAREELAGGQDQTMELFVRVNNPFVIGENAQWVEFIDDAEVQTAAVEQVAEDNDISVDEVNENIDDFEDEIYDARWQVQEEQEHPLVNAIQTVADRYDVDASSIAGEIYDLGSEATPEAIEQLIRGNDDISYAQDPETGTPINSQLIAEVIEEMGFDSIILKNADTRFSNMRMEHGTAHVHIFDSNKTNIKSATGNSGAFNPADPDIFKQRQDEAPQVRGYFDTRNNMIRLTEASDQSTFLHESAHFFLEMERKFNSPRMQKINDWWGRNAGKLAAEANSEIVKRRSALADAEAVTVTAADVNQWLDEGTTGDQNKDVAIHIATHEQFARGFERYLMEGKAPSLDLREAFRAFSRWLTDIYRRMRGDLDVNLDDEMRQTFARMLATEEQIALAEAEQQYRPLFTDAAMAGMTEEQFAEYQAKGQKATDKATETLRDKLISELTRQTKKWWNDELRNRAQVNEEELKTQRVYRASETLKDKDGALKLDRAMVKEMLGVDRIPPSLRNMTVTGAEGATPDDAAAFLGYDSGDQMIKEIAAAPGLKAAAKEQAEAEMKQEHGDILNDGTINKMADDAVHNEQRATVMLEELKALAKENRRPAIDRGVIKGLAIENIHNLALKDIRPDRYRRAEVKAAVAAQQAMDAGDKALAQQEKTRQVMNFHLWRAAVDAQDQAKKITKNATRYRKKSIRTIIAKAGNGYLEQIDGILDRFQFSNNPSLKALQKQRQDISGWAADRAEEGDNIQLSGEALAENYRAHYREIPFSELLGIDESMRNIEHVARFANKVQLEGERITFEELKSKWLKHLGQLPTRFTATRTDVVENTSEKTLRSAMSQMTKIPFLASWLDGGRRVGLSHDIMIQPLTDAARAEQLMWGDVGKVVMDAIKGRSKEDVKRHNRKLFIPELDAAKKNGRVERFIGEPDQYHLMGHQVLSVALNTGNESNLRKMLLGEGWAKDGDEISINNPYLQAILKHMTKSDWDMVQLIWDQIDTLYEPMAAVHKESSGLDLPKVQSSKVETPFGEYAGGYYPVKYDPERSKRANDNQVKQDEQVNTMFADGGFIRPTVDTGAKVERTEYHAPIRFDLGVVPNHIQEVIHYITHFEAVRRIYKITNDPDIAKAITEKVGAHEYRQLRPWLNDLAKDGREAPSKTYIDSILRRLRFGTTLGMMGFKVSTGLIQISGLSNTFAEVGSRHTWRALRTILRSPETIQEQWEFTVKNSKVMGHRVNTLDRELKNALNEISGRAGKLAWVQEASMKHIALIQTFMVDLPTWYAAYYKGIDQARTDLDVENFDSMADYDAAVDEKAFKLADWTVENVQGSGMTKDLPALMRNQAEGTRMMTMFMTFFSALWNLERDMVKGAKSKNYSPTTIAAKAMFLFAIPVLFEMFMRGDLEDDDEKDAWEKYLTNLTLFPVQSVPFVRDALSAVGTDFDFQLSPIGKIMESGIKGSKAVAEGLISDEDISASQLKGATKLVGAWYGIPGTSQVWATGEHINDVITEGEELTLHQLAFGPKRE